MFHKMLQVISGKYLRDCVSVVQASCFRKYVYLWKVEIGCCLLEDASDLGH